MALVPRGSPVLWWWVMEEEADGILHCTVQGTGTGRSVETAHLIQPEEAC